MFVVLYFLNYVQINIFLPYKTTKVCFTIGIFNIRYPFWKMNCVVWANKRYLSGFFLNKFANPIMIPAVLKVIYLQG